MQMSCLAEGALPGRGVIAKISSVVLIYASLERSKKLLFLELPAVIFETPIEDFSLYFCGLIFETPIEDFSLYFCGLIFCIYLPFMCTFHMV